jgi:hypothetical protein
MATKRGKLAALAALSIGVIVLAASGFAFRGRILERWYIHRLDSEDPAVQERAAAKLAELGSACAVPRLIEIYIAARDEPHFSGRALLLIGPPALREILEKLKQEGESHGSGLGWLI